MILLILIFNFFFINHNPNIYLHGSYLPLWDLQPVGVVGAITPWNFPLAMITRKVSLVLNLHCPIFTHFHFKCFYERVDFTMEAAQREHQNVKTQRIEVGL